MTHTWPPGPRAVAAVAVTGIGVLTYKFPALGELATALWSLMGLPVSQPVGVLADTGQLAQASPGIQGQIGSVIHALLIAIIVIAVLLGIHMKTGDG